MLLNYKEIGNGPPIFILHGLFGSSDNWSTISKSLQDHYRIILPDLRNHGNSPKSDVWNYKVMVEDIIELYNLLNIQSAMVVGHSMGGKVAMELCLNNENLVDKLVVVDIAPKYYPVHHDHILKALNSLDLKTITSRNQAEASLAKQIHDGGVRNFLLKNIGRNSDGFYWKINLEVITKNIEQVGKSQVVDKPIETPTLFVRGSESNYIEDQDMTHIRSMFSNVKLATVKNAGHWVHSEKPAEISEMLKYFFNN